MNAVVLVALSACATSPGEQEADENAPQVATLTTPEPERSASTQPKAQRPRERLDTTAEEFQELLGPYHSCLREQGVPERKTAGSPDRPPLAGPGERVLGPEELEKFEAANRICEPQFYPLPPWEKDPANPEARDFALDVVKCLKGKGVRYVEVAEDGIAIALGGDHNDSRSISMGLDLIPECERKVAAESK
ncbi:hypothetical protein [Micromonospora sp. DT229]|uniref:hypothetical protein n=1 Tax=Micromonospora sp. DT229 TaxID=3393430 RepID=UPI003CF64F4A